MFQRGDLRARHGAWQLALDDYRAGLKRDPTDVLNWLKAAALYLKLDDLAGYRRHAKAALERFCRTTDPATAERTAKLGLLGPPPAEEIPTLGALTDLAVTAGATSDYLSWFQLARGMALFRDDQFAAATDWLRKVNASHNSHSLCRALAVIFLAMCESRLGEGDQARTSLESARKILDASTPKGDDPGPGWLDLFNCQIALREAEAVVLYDRWFPADPFAN